MKRRWKWWILGGGVTGLAGLAIVVLLLDAPPAPSPTWLPEALGRMGWYQVCREDGDCARVAGVRCSCRSFGVDHAINRRWEDPWRVFSRKKWEKETGRTVFHCFDAYSPAPRCTHDVVPVCLRNRCVLRSRSTGEVWAD